MLGNPEVADSDKYILSLWRDLAEAVNVAQTVVSINSCSITLISTTAGYVGHQRKWVTMYYEPIKVSRERGRLQTVRFRLL